MEGNEEKDEDKLENEEECCCSSVFFGILDLQLLISCLSLRSLVYMYSSLPALQKNQSTFVMPCFWSLCIVVNNSDEAIHGGTEHFAFRGDPDVQCGLSVTFTFMYMFVPWFLKTE